MHKASLETFGKLEWICHKLDRNKKEKVDLPNKTPFSELTRMTFPCFFKEWKRRKDKKEIVPHNATAPQLM